MSLQPTTQKSFLDISDFPNTHLYTYEDLVRTHEAYIERYSEERLLTLVKERKPPVHLGSSLIRDGWDFSWEAPEERGGVCLFLEKRIMVHPSYKGYELAKALAHESIHAWYGPDSSDSVIIFLRHYFRRALVELQARHVVSNPEMTGNLFKAFGIPEPRYNRKDYRKFLP